MAEINNYESKDIDEKKRYTRSGVIFRDVPLAPVNVVMNYSALELGAEDALNNGFKENDVVKVYRPTSFFTKSVINNAITIPMTNDHPGRLHGHIVNRKNTKLRIGNAYDPYIKDSKLYYKYVEIFDNDAINDYESGKKELSIGYLPTKGEWVDVDNRRKLGYDLIEGIAEINHFSLVNKGRAGHHYRLHEKTEVEDSMSLEKRVDSLEVILNRINNKMDKMHEDMTSMNEEREDKKDEEREDRRKEDAKREDRSKEDAKREDRSKEDAKREDRRKEDKDGSEDLKEDKKDKKIKELEGKLDEMTEKCDSLEEARKNDVFLQESGILQKLFESIPQDQLGGFIGGTEFTTKEKVVIKDYSKKVHAALEKRTKGYEDKTRLNTVKLQPTINAF